MIGLLGKKLGMTHVYDEYGRRHAATAIQAGPCTIIQLREPTRHAYRALQVGFEPVKDKELTKPELGQFKKAGTSAFRYVREFRLPAPSSGSVGAGRQASPQAGLTGSAAAPAETEGAEDGEWKVGQQLTVELFKEHELIDVTGVSVGKGFQGGMKRWHWKGGPRTHGSTSHRRPGSIGSTTTPGRVWRGHHLPGHMGGARVTVQNVRIVRLDPQHHLLLVEGAIPGAERGLVIVTKSQKRPGAIKKPQAFQAVAEEEETKKAKPGKRPE